MIGPQKQAYTHRPYRNSLHGPMETAGSHAPGGTSGRKSLKNTEDIGGFILKPASAN
jgi:hypothetical protein